MITRGSEPGQLSATPPEAACAEPANNWPSRPEAIYASPWEGLCDGSQPACP